MNFKAVIKNLKETYYGSFYKSNSQIYKNPCGGDLNHLDKMFRKVRFIADLGKKDLYVFDQKYLHDLAKKKLSLNNNSKDYFMGLAEKNNGRWSIIESSALNNPKLMKHYLKQNFSWINKYNFSFDCDFKDLMSHYAKKG